MSTKSLPVFVDAATCTKCGGACCSHYPGLTHPNDWGAPDRAAMVLKLREGFKSGLWTVDYWEGGDPRNERKDIERGYFVRPAMRGYEGRTVHAGWTGACARFAPGKGCDLEHDARPMGCRGLRPMRDNETSCVVEYGDKPGLVVAWLDYHDVLAEAGGLDSDDDDDVDPFSKLAAMLGAMHR